MKKIIASLVLVALITSCTKDEDKNFDDSLQGKWVLTNVICYCAFGDDPDFSGHTLTFDVSNLKVENTGEFDFLSSATGEYSLKGNVITFDSGRQFRYSIQSNMLELIFVDNPIIADDELVLEYKRD